MRWWLGRRTSVAFAALALLALMAAFAPYGTRDAEAHAALVTANPSNNETLTRSPARVILRFSEPIERRLTKIEVFGAEDNRVDEGDIAFDDSDPAFASIGVATLEPGLYFVRWSNVSTVDGHGVNGQYPFIVLNPDGTFPEGVTLDNTGGSQSGGGDLLPNNLDAALKWIALLAIATMGGAAFFLAVVLRPAASFLEDESYQRATDAGERWVTNLAHALLPVAFIATALLTLLTVNRFTTDTSVWTYITDVRAGQYRALALVLFISALAGADLLFLGGSRVKRNVGLGVLIAAAAGAMFSYSLVSHSAAGSGRFWSITSDYVHFLASAAWLGALVMLPPVLRRQPAELDDDRRFLFLANTFDRFSIIAGLSVMAVLATGLFNGLAAVPSWDALTGTTYGKVLIAKLVLTAPLLAIAGLNAFVLKPRLVGAIDTMYQQGGAGDLGARATASERLTRLRAWLPRTIIVEIALVVAVFAAVSVLTQTSTAKGEIAQERAAEAANSEFSQAFEDDGVAMTLEVSPNRVGINEYSVIAQNSEGQPLVTVTQARLRFTYDDVENALAPSEIILNRFGDGEFRGAGAYFTQPGNWRVQATIRRSDGDDVAGTFILPVLETQQTVDTAAGAFELPFDTFQWNEVAGAFLALLGVAVVLYRRQLAWLPEYGRRAGMTIALVMLIGGGVLAFGVDTHSNASDARAGNPIAPTADSVARGKALFQQNCMVCHGVDGRGDGPQAASLDPAPTDFRLHLPLHTDPQFWAFIANGVSGSAMPAFKAELSEEDIWNLVNYLRASFSEAPTE